MIDQQGFLLSRQWRDSRRGLELELWVATDNGPVQLIVGGQQVLFFLAAEQSQQAELLLQTTGGWQHRPLALRDFSMRNIEGFYFTQQKQLRAARQLLRDDGLDPLEADINPCDRFLMERSIRGALRFKGAVQNKGQHQRVVNPAVASSDYQPRFKVVSLDIETAMHELTLYSIAVYGRDDSGELRKVFMLADHEVDSGVDIFSNEKSLLLGFMSWLASYSPDILIGWNVINFDLWFLERLCQKHRIAFSLGRAGSRVHWRELDSDGDRRAVSIPGRVVLDGIELLKAAFYRFESFSLNAVAGELLGEGKLITGNDRGEAITGLFLNNKKALAEYNLQDCKLVLDIFDKTALLDFAIARSRLTGLPLDRIGGSVASFDFRYLPLLHRQGFVAPNGHLVDEIEHSPGGFVMESRPGIYDHVLVLDFKSLYPSIIRSFNIDPMGMALGLSGELEDDQWVEGFKGGRFSRERHLLPGIIAELWQARDQAKADKDAPLSQAIKIIMNSFYGVLGSSGCRFFDSRLASSITRRGHQIIQESAQYIEQQGWSVIYGDTDSVFVWLKDVESSDDALHIGTTLAKSINVWWKARLMNEYGLEGVLEMEFETHYRRFLMPTIRGSDQGSKKRYAGLIEKNGEQQLIFKGLENVRTDWTRLARDFQMELYRRVFFGEPYRDYICSVVEQVTSGERDSELVYRKRLRRKLDEYQRNIPPHVQAARKLASDTDEKVRRGDWVEYVITLNGAEPVSVHHSPIDYQHYIDRQLEPVADGILYFLDSNFAEITGRQLAMF